MKNLKRFLAILGVLFLLGLYAATFIFALIDSPAAGGWFKASLFCTNVIPVLLYGYIIVYLALKGRGADTKSQDTSSGGENQ